MNTIKLSSKLKLDLFNSIKNEPNVFGFDKNNEGTLNFILNIWDLQVMPSWDPRFKNAYQDVYQHTINNNDWEVDYLFIERLKLLENDEKYALFIESIVNPRFKSTEDEIVKFVLLINPFLEKEGYKLGIRDYTEDGVPNYSIFTITEVDSMPLNQKKNNIPFFVIKDYKGKANKYSSQNFPSKFPSFVLVLNNNWNDFTMKTSFSLFYHPVKEMSHYLGETKIMSEDEKEPSEVFSNEFTVLNETFCSLGQDEKFYFNLKKHFGKDLESILFALKDAAFFPLIQEKFEKLNMFKRSLMREDYAERILREVKYKIYGYDLSRLYKFKYSFQPLYSSYPIDIDFNYDSEEDLPNRIYAIIGKNGTGKTQLITSLPNNIAERKEQYFIPRTPLFSKVITVSYSVFDNFSIPKKNAAFNYVYCGLRNEKEEIISERGMVLRFHNSWKKIEELERIDKWRKILSNFIEKEIIDQFILKRDQITSRGNTHRVSINGFHLIKNRLSSGQNILLYIITEIVANIRFDSLLLYDEPETHLHPNAITQLINTIYDLVNDFQSYCLITTHSPLIIRELPSRNVYILERHENVPSLRRISLESFGENLDTLTEIVFGNREVKKQYKVIIENLVKEGKTYEDLVSLLETDNVPLSLNTIIYIKSLYRKHEKPQAS